MTDHAWFENRYPGRFMLIKMINDATNRLLMARFVPTDAGAANRQLVIDYLHRHGRPVVMRVAGISSLEAGNEPGAVQFAATRTSR